MTRTRIVFSALLIVAGMFSPARAERDLRVFGYFQNTFQYERPDDGTKSSSFLLQHLNMLFRKEMSQSWSTYINIEFTNSFSSSQGWGTANIHEAWALYRYDNRFNIKLGLQIPTFNNLYDIKDRTPLLPYIIRPVVYESSLEDLVALEQYVPNRAFVQAYGFLPLGRWKFDYAAYVGNSPNINSDPENGQTGIDTTDTFLGGGRLGVRYDELKAGISSSYDKSNFLYELAERVGGGRSAGRELGRIRIGGDLSFRWNGLFFESEYIAVLYDDKGSDVDLDLQFYYLLLGYDLSDRLQAYASYEQTREDAYFRFPEPGFVGTFIEADEHLSLKIPFIGLAYRLSERLTAKIQGAQIHADLRLPEGNYQSKSNYIAAALSAYF